METLENAVRQLLATLNDPEADREGAQATARQVIAAAKGAPPSARDAALRQLLPGLESLSPERSGLAAITGGSLVEEGASPDILAPTLLEFLPVVLTLADRFVERLRAALPPQTSGTGGESETEEGDDDGEEGGLYIDGRRVPDDILMAVYEEERNEGSCFFGLNFWCMPTIACLSLSAKARQVARERQEDLLPLCQSLGDLNSGAGFLWKLIQVLDDEMLLVLHPDTLQGFRCRISGIVDNFQLHTLLADALIGTPATSPPSSPGGLLGRLMGRGKGNGTGPKAPAEGKLPGTRPDPRIVAIMRGDGPQQFPAPSHGVWNLYQWYALNPSGKLPGVHDQPDSWVWNEGLPADIERFEGERILLLGPPAYERSWSTTRLFANLKASVVVVETLKAEQVQDWIRRLSAASAARPGHAE